MDARRRYRLHPNAAYLCALGYVFIDLNGRVLRMEASDFAAFRASCAAGIAPDAVAAFAGVLTECQSANEALESFQSQELPAYEY